MPRLSLSPRPTLSFLAGSKSATMSGGGRWLMCSSLLDLLFSRSSSPDLNKVATKNCTLRLLDEGARCKIESLRVVAYLVIKIVRQTMPKGAKGMRAGGHLGSLETVDNVDSNHMEMHNVAFIVWRSKAYVLTGSAQGHPCAQDIDVCRSRAGATEHVGLSVSNAESDVGVNSYAILPLHRSRAVMLLRQWFYKTIVRHKA
ncbi:hypothetical protein DY000_02039271 [Brassica cretica]|uniref:Uncharacterized protein n=1 Tax=Brassica cretica TaxID=69181 RepID=A0ABQ7BPR1_BRACR|nr:hypothetical protein DY000_02039271 [Brassica cretica]